MLTANEHIDLCVKLMLSELSKYINIVIKRLKCCVNFVSVKLLEKLSYIISETLKFGASDFISILIFFFSILFFQRNRRNKCNRLTFDEYVYFCQNKTVLFSLFFYFDNLNENQNKMQFNLMFRI